MKKMHYKIMILTIFALTVFDAWATWYGVSSGYIQEGNVIARTLFGFSIPWTCAIIVVWTGALLWFISRQKYRWIPYAMLAVIAVKTYIAALHLTWLTRL